MKIISFANLKNISANDGGLSSHQVAKQRSLYGKNIIVEVSGNPWLVLFIDTIKDPMIWFLVGIGSVFYLTGELIDAITLFVAVLPLMFMDAILHWRTQASTSTLKGQLASQVRVLRESKFLQIDSSELVPGDTVIVATGDILPADGIFKTTENVQIDESSLTGESLPITKAAANLDPFSYSSESKVAVAADSLGYAGTRVLSGNATLIVLFTGTQTSYGEIVQSVSRMPHQRTPLQKAIDQLVRLLVFAAISFCLLLAAIRVYQGHGWLDALLTAATLAVAALPEEFPVVFTFFLGVGIFRLAQKRALVRQAVSVENIGRITQICTDKTGTITQGTLKLSHLIPAEGLSEDSLLQNALASASSGSDPLDLAIHEMAKSKNLQVPARLRTIPFTEDRKRETSYILHKNDKTLITIKGSPETILSMTSLPLVAKQSWKEKVSYWAKSGHKVIGCAAVEASAGRTDDEPEQGYEFNGLLIFEDPIRPEAPDALSYCHKAGIRVLMITGDHPDTATAIAKAVGLTVKEEPRVLCAEDEPQKFSEQWLSDNPDFIKKFDVIARCKPLHKFWIVQSLKKSGEIVAVTGDGVNDVPALKAADIGIAMGERGTRSAREVSSIILGDDNFNTIIKAIREGRQLFRNLKKSFEYLLLIHIPLVLTAAVIPLLGYPLVFMPVHIVWLELIIHPTALLCFQEHLKEEETFKNQKSFFNSSDVFRICLVGFLLATLIGWSFVNGIENQGLDIATARANSIALLSMWSVVSTLYLTQFRSSISNILSSCIALLSISLIQASGELNFLKLAPLSLRDWLQIVLIVAIAILLNWAIQKLATAKNHFKKHDSTRIAR